MSRRTWHVGVLAAMVFVLIVIGATVSAAGCSSADAESNGLKLGQNDDGKSYSIKVGGLIQVIIPGNPTTGYIWNLWDPDGKTLGIVEQLGEAQYAPDNADEALVGSGGVYTFTFKAVAKGEVALRLAYAKPWESVMPLQYYTVTLTIE